MVSTLDSITSLCWCYMLFSRSIFAHFVFMHTNICIFVVFFSLSLLLSFNFFCFGSIYRHLGIVVYGYVCEWCVCVRAFLSISFKFSHCFWCAFGWTGVKRILFVRRLHGLAFFCVCVVVCWPTFWEWQQSTTSIMHTKSSVNSFGNKKSIGNFFDFFVCRSHKTLQHAHLYRRHGGVVCIIHLKCKRHRCVHICGTYGPKIKQSLSLKMQFHKLQYKILVCIHV